MSNEFVGMLNKYLVGKAWLAARPPCKDLEDKFYAKVKAPLAAIIETDEEMLLIMRICDKFNAVKVMWKEKKAKA